MPDMFDIPVTQYIGPKIVPHFAEPSEWNISSEYDALSIVTNGGNTYWAKYNVPAGIDISNTEYWYLSAYPDAQIQAYRQEVLIYAQQVEGVETDVANLQSDVSDISDNISDISSDISTINNHIDSIDDSIENISNSIETIDSNIDSLETESIFNKSYVGTAISPITIGTHYRYYDNEIFQGNALCVKNGVVYGGCHNSDDSRTIIYAANIASNNFIFTREFSNAHIGHCNSMAYDNIRNQFMIAANPGYGIVIADPAFDNVMASNLWPFTSWAGRIGFDYITGYGWCIDEANSGVTTRKLYVLAPDATEFEFFCNITLPVYDLQDICVRDNKLFITTTTNNWAIYNIDIINKTCTIIECGDVTPTDASDIYYLGELEGCEFDENGYLYLQFTCAALDVITNVPYQGKQKIPTNRSSFQITNCTISNSYRNVFKNGVNELKTIAELDVRDTSKIRTVQYSSDITENYGGRIKDLEIIIPEGITVTFNTTSLELWGGVCSFVCMGNIISNLSEIISIYNSGAFLICRFGLNSNCTFNTSSRKIIRSNYNYGGMVFCEQVPSGFTGLIETVALASNTWYCYGPRVLAFNPVSV